MIPSPMMILPNSPEPFPKSLLLRLTALLYQLLLHLAAPLLMLLMLIRSRREPRYRAHLADRFGLGKPAPENCVWIFAASLGETRAVSPLVRDLLAEGHHVLMTHSTPAGLAESEVLFAREISEGRVTQGYMAADFFWAVRLFLRRQRPAVGLVVESELWPGMLLEAHRAGIPVVQVNGNLLDRTVERDAKILGGVRLQLFGGFSRVLTKSPEHVARYLHAGVTESRIRRVGELKFDQKIDPAHLRRAAEIRAGWDTRPTLMIASSVLGEEDQLCRMITDLARLPTRPRFIWVPRSPQRFDAVAERVEQTGLRMRRRGEVLAPDLAGKISDDFDVLIGDSLGEMNFYYPLSDLVFVGATLVDHGGHNIVEPLALGRPVVVGPSLFGISFPAHAAINAGAAESLPDAATLTERIRHLLSDADALAKFTHAAKGFCAMHRGATARSVAALRPYLPAAALTLRPATSADAQMLLKWRNDPVSRAMSGQSDVVTKAEHIGWFEAALSDPNRLIHIGEWNGAPFGMVRLDIGAEGMATVSIAIAPQQRGKGLARALLRCAIEASPTPRFRALIKPDNGSSIATFAGLGFFRVAEADGFLEYRMERLTE